MSAPGSDGSASSSTGEQADTVSRLAPVRPPGDVGRDGSRNADGNRHESGDLDPIVYISDDDDNNDWWYSGSRNQYQRRQHGPQEHRPLTASRSNRASHYASTSEPVQSATTERSAMSEGESLGGSSDSLSGESASRTEGGGLERNMPTLIYLDDSDDESVPSVSLPQPPINFAPSRQPQSRAFISPRIDPYYAGALPPGTSSIATPAQPDPRPLVQGDILYWHHLKRTGEIPGVCEDSRARMRGGCDENV